MGTVTAVIFGLTLLLGQVFVEPSGPDLSSSPPTSTAPDSSATGSSDTSHSSSTTVQNVFPEPNPQDVITTEQQGAPVILQAALQNTDEDAAKQMTNALDLALSLASIRQDLILSPAVQEINDSMVRIVYASLGLVFAALALRGILSNAFGSDSREAFEMLGKVPLWAALAVTSLSWYAAMLTVFAALGGMIASSAHGAFGPTLSNDFWSNTGIGLFAALSGLVMFILMLFFAVKLFANTAFLAFCALVAPVFIFLKCTPWTAKWGDNWFRMVPASAGDTLAMLAMLVVGAAVLDHVELSSAVESIIFDIGLILAIPLVEELFGLRHSSAGGRVWDLLFVSRLRRAVRAANVSSPTSTTPANNPSQPTRAPRWNP